MHVPVIYISIASQPLRSRIGDGQANVLGYDLLNVPVMPGSTRVVILCQNKGEYQDFIFTKF